MEFEGVIGLEVHAQLLTRSKIFCGCSTGFGVPANTHACPVCLGLPGALPVINREAVAMGIKTGLALGCRINPDSLFARKNYFYPDLPKGYQISQYERPLAEHGKVELLDNGPEKTGAPAGIRSFRVRRLHLEEDAGKSVHQPGGDSQIDLNRAGIPLVEIVSQPDFRSSHEASQYLQHLRRVLLYLEVCDGNMEQGSLRCDANVSVRPVGSGELGTKVEIKNLNSFRFLQKALDHEILRQTGRAREGLEIVQETRLWDESAETTVSMRSKEEAHDYRYFPEPDLLPLTLSDEWLNQLAGQLPELPNQRRLRFMDEYGFSHEEAFQLTQTRSFADYFEKSVECHPRPREIFHWMMGELTRFLKRDERPLEEAPIHPGQLAKLVKLVDSGEISGTIAKRIFEKMYETAEDPEALLVHQNLRQISDEGPLREAVQRALESNPDKVVAFQAGKTGLLGFFMGEVMRETGGQANPGMVRRMLEEALRPAK